MADQNTPSQASPIRVVLTDTSGNIIGSLPITIADNGDYVLGSVNDAAVTGDNTGTVSAKLRGLDKILSDIWDPINHVLKTTGGVGVGAVTIVDGSDIAQGATADAAWSGSGAGTVIAILKKIAAGGGSAVSIADGADVAQGTTTDASSANTVIGLLKNLKAALAGTLTVAGTVTANLGTIAGVATETTLALIKAKTDNVDVLLSTRLKPADTLAGVTTVTTVTTITNPVAVTGTFWQATQPVSGTVTANAGTNLNTSALALDSTVAKDATIVSSNTKLDTLHTDLGLVAKDATLTTLDTDFKAATGSANTDGSDASYGTALYWLKKEKAQNDQITATLNKILTVLTPAKKVAAPASLLHGR